MTSFDLLNPLVSAESLRINDYWLNGSLNWTPVNGAPEELDVYRWFMFEQKKWLI